MSSESGQRLPMEELKRRNAPQPIPTQACPSKEEWENLLLMIRALHRLTAEQSNTLENLNQHAAAHTALLREVSNQREPCPAQAQMEALARDVAEIQALLRQAGKKKEMHSCKWLDWLPDFDLIVVAKWIVLVLLIVAALLGMGYGTATVVSNIRNLFL